MRRVTLHIARSAKVTGCKRYRCKVRSESVSESASEHERAEVKGTKAGKQLKEKDVDDFMAGPVNGVTD